MISPLQNANYHHSYMDGPISFIITNYKHEGKRATPIPSRLLCRLSGKLGHETTTDQIFIITTSDFPAYLARVPATYLCGGFFDKPDWITKLKGETAWMDLDALAAHLTISCLQFVLKSKMCATTLDGGFHPNRAMMFHIFAVSSNEDRSRQILVDSLFLTLVNQPKLETDFRSSSPLENTELLGGMWLSEFKNSINDQISFYKIKAGTPFCISQSVYTEDRISDRGALRKIVEGIDDARNVGALNYENFTTYTNNTEISASKFDYLKNRGYLPSSMRLPLPRPPTSGPIVTTSVTGQKKSNTKKRKAPTSTAQPASKTARKDNKSMTNKGKSQVIKPATSQLKQGKNIMASPSQSASPITILLECSGGHPVTRPIDYITEVGPKAKQDLFRRPLLKILKYNSIAQPIMQAFLGYAHGEPQINIHSWTLERVFKVFSAAETLQATAVRDRIFPVLKTRF